MEQQPLPFYKHKYFPVTIAIIVALLATIYYVVSGQGSMDKGTRALQNSPAVEQVKIEQTDAGQTTAKVKCKDGSEYDVYYPPGSTNYDSLANNNCEQ
jgi:hypothetical protein